MNREQLKTILWLRWRLMCNQWTRRGAFGAVLAALVGIGAILLAAGCFGAALFGAAFGLKEASPAVIMGVWFGATAAFLFFSLIELITELQRSETIDLLKLLHLPVALGQLFVINYLISHLTLSIIVMVPVMLGLSIGLVIARGPEMALLIPLSLSMVVMITAWTYCLRGWLASMMSNPRRRRTVIMCISLSFILLAQGPNLYFNILGRHATANSKPAGNGRDTTWPDKFSHLVAVQRFIPPLWVPVGARGLADQNVRPALYGTLGCLGLAFLGLRRAYHSSIKFYRGDSGGKTATRSKATDTAKPAHANVKTGSSFLEWRLPAVPEQSAALALATLRSLLRAPEVKMALAGSVISILIVGAMIFIRSPPSLSDEAKPFIATGVVAFSTFILVQFFTNQFGFDRDGFRSLVLSPADRRLILLGKNLAILPVGFGLGASLLLLVSVWLHLPLLAVVAGLFQLVTLLLIASLGGNLLSILMPFRIQPGTMRPTKMPALATFVMILCQLLLPAAMAPVLAGPALGWLWHRAELPPFVPVNLIGSAALCGVMALIYWQALTPLGRLLQHRETKILGVVTVEVE